MKMGCLQFVGAARAKDNRAIRRSVEETRHMKIMRLTAENVKKLIAVEIQPTGEIVTLSGKNGAGKTSILDCIWWALAGASHIQTQPIRHGETKARIRLDLGELIVERKFSETGSTLSVQSADGARYPSPQKMLDSLLGELCFDPLAFTRYDAKKQFDELRRIAKLEVDVDAIAAANKEDFAARTDVNRDAKAKRAAAGAVQVRADLPTEAEDEAALLDQIQKAGEHNAAIVDRQARRESAARDVADKRRDAEQALAVAEKAAELADKQAAETIERAGGQIREMLDAAQLEAEALRLRASQLVDQANERAANLNKRALEDADRLKREGAETAQRQRAAAESATAAADALQAKLDAAEPLPAPIDVTGLRAQLDNAKVVAANNARRAERDRLAAEAAELEKKSEALTKAMADRERQKVEAIKKAALPVEGLGFGDGFVTYKGVPLEQASSAEQLRVSLAIAMAANPKLRVIRIQDGSLLDDDSMAAVAEMARAGDYQVWIERVAADAKVGIIIEDGMARVAGAEVPANA